MLESRVWMMMWHPISLPFFSLPSSLTLFHQSRGVWCNDSPLLEVVFQAAWVTSAHTFFFLCFALMTTICLAQDHRCRFGFGDELQIALCDYYSPEPHSCISIIISTEDRTGWLRGKITSAERWECQHLSFYNFLAKIPFSWQPDIL